MKHLVGALLCILVFTSALSAEVVLQNTSKGTLYFTLLPLGEDGKSRYLDTPAMALAYLKENTSRLSSLPAYSAAPVEGGVTPRLLLGFIVEPGSARFPLVSLRLPVSPSGTAFAVDGRKETAYGFSAWEIDYKSSPITIDNRYLDWIKVPELAKFGAGFDPTLFSWEKNGRRETRKTETSLTWKKGGTQVEILKILYSYPSIFIMISSFSEMSEKLSYFFYLFENTSGSEKRRLTLEIPIRKTGGPVFLWESGKEKPLYVGVYTRDIFLLEAKLDLRYLSPEILERNYDGLRVDFTSCFFSPEGNEEFYYSSFSGKDVARKTE
jgi:hypothetical protein